MEDRTRQSLESAVTTLLRPLVRLVLKRGLACGELVAILKKVYVDVAMHEFGVEGRKQTVSRVSLMTGLTRKEVSRLQSESGEENTWRDRARVNRAARVLSAWVREPRFLDKSGRPASLAFETASGPSFSELVREHGADVTSRSVLDELLRVGAIRSLKDGRFRPVERAYVPQTDDSEKVAILGTDVADLISSIDHNLTEGVEERFFQRKVAYDNLPASYLPKLRARLRRQGQRFLEQLDEDMSGHDRDVNPDADEGPARRAMIGLFYYEDDGEPKA